MSDNPLSNIPGRITVSTKKTGQVRFLVWIMRNSLVSAQSF